MRFFYIILPFLVISCSSYQVKHKKTDTCFDYESCNRACKILGDEKACQNRRYYKYN